ncbi:MAG TPA: nucleotidyltransferase family protein [Crenotrichaceae bacterium]|nr:nucleotidyltransferase family protein [Crenotrichaceae bacterium]
MKAMILAAGRGERLRPLTDDCPKPLLMIGNKPIIVHTIEALAANGITEIIINLSYKADLIKQALGDGKQFGVNLSYSDEGEDALETAGGILKALSFFNDQPFLVVNGDIYTDYAYSKLLNQSFKQAYLVLVPNPEHHPHGDFGLEDGLVVNDADQLLTFSGIGVYQPKMFASLSAGRHALGPLLRASIQNHVVTGELYKGVWMDIGTVQRYQKVNDWLSADQSVNV